MQKTTDKNISTGKVTLYIKENMTPQDNMLNGWEKN